MNFRVLGRRPSLPFPVLGTGASRGFCGSCVPGSDLEPVLSALLEDAGPGALASIRLEKPGLALTWPGVTFADAGLTVTGLALAGGLEQMEEGRAAAASAASADSDWRATTEDGRGQSVLTARSHTVKLMSITAVFDYRGINYSPNYSRTPPR